MGLFVAVAAPANAAMTPTLGKRWKSGTTVKVYSSLPSVFNPSLTAALRDLNGSGAHIHLQRVTKRRGANVVMVLQDVPGADGNTAPRSYRIGSLTVIHISPKVVWEYQLKGRRYAAGLLLAHELSHSLGLAHYYGHCSVVGSFWDLCKTAESFDLLHVPVSPATRQSASGRPLRRQDQRPGSGGVQHQVRETLRTC